MNLLVSLVSLALAMVTAPANAQTGPQPSSNVAPAANVAPMVDGEVRKVDKDAGKITLKHGPIPNLEMPGMTMVFRVKDTAMLDQVQAGDKVRFTADKVGGQFTVTSIEVTK